MRLPGRVVEEVPQVPVREAVVGGDVVGVPVLVEPGLAVLRRRVAEHDAKRISYTSIEPH
jgi:hypothetical protein